MADSSYFIDFIKDYGKKTPYELIVEWNNTCFRFDDKFLRLIHFVATADLNVLFPKTTDYVTAVNSGQYNPNHSYYTYNDKWQIVTFANLDDVNSPFDVSIFKSRLYQNALEDLIYCSICENYEGNELCVFWNEYCQATGSKDFVFPNPDINDNNQWVQVDKNNQLKFFEYSDDAMSMLALKNWFIQNKPEKWVHIYDKAKKDLDQYC